MVLNGESSKEHPVHAGVFQGFTLCPTLFLIYIPDVICNIAIFADVTTLSSLLLSKCDQASDLWQQPELASELKSDLQYTVDWDRK